VGNGHRVGARGYGRREQSRAAVRTGVGGDEDGN
jgi:hypothetical protein